jgi:hypothetical protein
LPTAKEPEQHAQFGGVFSLFCAKSFSDASGKLKFYAD